MSPFATMPDEAEKKLKDYVKTLTAHLGEDIKSIVLYGSLARGEYVSGRSNINLLLVTAGISGNGLRQTGRIQQKWAKEHIVAPLMLTQDELRHAFEVFPLEFLEMSDAHRILEGSNPFVGCMINEARLLAQCEQELCGNLIRVRQRYVEGWGRNEAAQALLPISLTTLIPCLRGVYRLLSVPAPKTTDAVLDQLPKVLGMEPGGLHEVWLLKRGRSSPGQKEWPRLMERFLATLEDLIRRVDALKREGRFA